jgi:hypothetical protein
MYVHMAIRDNISIAEGIKYAKSHPKQTRRRSKSPNVRN